MWVPAVTKLEILEIQNQDFMTPFMPLWGQRVLFPVIHNFNGYTIGCTYHRTHASYSFVNYAQSDIGSTNIRARSLLDVHGCTDNSTKTSVILRTSKRMFACWTVQPGRTRRWASSVHSSNWWIESARRMLHLYRLVSTRSCLRPVSMQFVKMDRC